MNRLARPIGSMSIMNTLKPINISSSSSRYFSLEPTSFIHDDSDPIKATVDSIPNSGMLDTFGRAYATGRRKTSIARVWIKEGSGQFKINNKNLKDYFQPIQREQCLLPFITTSTSGEYDVWCTTKGGGMSGQAGAIRLGMTVCVDVM